MGTLINHIGVLSFVLLFLSSCARDLKSDEDLTLAPKEFDQEIADVKLEASPILETSKLEKTSVAKKSPPAPKSSAKTAETSKKSPVAEVPPAPQSLSKHWPITVGEQIKLSMRWGVIEGGVVSMEVMPPKVLNGVTTLHYRAEVKSSKVLNLFYKIDNSIETWVDLQTLEPLRQEIKQRESTRWGRRVMVLQPKNNNVKFYEHMTKSNGEVRETRREDPMATGAQDVFGALYFHRFVHHMPGGFRFPVHDKGKDWFTDLKLLGKESLRVPAGTFQTRRYKVAPRLEGHLEPKGDIDVWLSDDERQLLVQFAAKIKVGTVTGELIEYVPGQKIDLPLPIWKTPVEALPQQGN